MVKSLKLLIYLFIWGLWKYHSCPPKIYYICNDANVYIKNFVCEFICIIFNIKNGKYIILIIV